MPDASTPDRRSARQTVADLLWWSVPGSTNQESKERANEMLDELTAERDAEIMRWLGKKALEYRAIGRKADRERADLITKLASQISRGAVRPNNTLLPAGVEPTFFEPGRTYAREHHGRTIRFLVRCVDTPPGSSWRVAFGWRLNEDGDWEPTDSDDFEGWTEVPADEAVTA